MKYTRYCRSLLSTPALVTERFAKAHRSGADICTVDLEDSVPLSLKEEALRRAREFFATSLEGGTPRHGSRRGIRINALTTAEGLRDVLGLRDFPNAPTAIVVPKVESPRDIEILDHVLGSKYPDLEYLAVVETSRGLDNLQAIAAASPRLRALIFGAADYSFDVGSRLSWEALVSARARLVNSARAAGIEAVDSPAFEVSDMAEVKTEALHARDLGFSGKVAIHPRQISMINEVFSPDCATLDRARRIISAGEERDFEIAVVDGVMVGTPFFDAARNLLEEFGT